MSSFKKYVINIRSECYLLAKFWLLIIYRYVVAVELNPEDDALAAKDLWAFIMRTTIDWEKGQ